jgi:hypothetical protein
MLDAELLLQLQLVPHTENTASFKSSALNHGVIHVTHKSIIMHTQIAIILWVNVKIKCAANI